MAENKKEPKKYGRVYIRVNMPKVETHLAGELHDRVSEVVKDFPGAEVEVSLMPLMPTR